MDYYFTGDLVGLLSNPPRKTGQTEDNMPIAQFMAKIPRKGAKASYCVVTCWREFATEVLSELKQGDKVKIHGNLRTSNQKGFEMSVSAPDGSLEFIKGGK
jgi:single-stranded DNA-binding protein